ncbi:MAG: hypothetical protein ACRD3T_00805, partial [Terriglobia bacterium]
SMSVELIENTRAAVIDRRYSQICSHLPRHYAGGASALDNRILIVYNLLSTHLARILLMSQSATAVPRGRIDVPFSCLGQIDPTAPSTNKAMAKSAKSPIKMRVGTMLSDAQKGFYASKATQLIENKRTDLGRYEQTHCENGRNPVKMRVRA